MMANPDKFKALIIEKSGCDITGLPLMHKQQYNKKF